MKKIYWQPMVNAR